MGEVELIRLPKIDDERGSLTFLQLGAGAPFAFKRVFYVYGVPDGKSRAGHALRSCEQLIVAVAGAFDVIVDDGETTSRTRLASPDCGFYIPPMTWLELEMFSPGAVCLVFASEPYKEASYIRSYDDFRLASAVC